MIVIINIYQSNYIHFAMIVLLFADCLLASPLLYSLISATTVAPTTTTSTTTPGKATLLASV